MEDKYQYFAVAVKGGWKVWHCGRCGRKGRKNSSNLFQNWKKHYIGCKIHTEV